MLDIATKLQQARPLARSDNPSMVTPAMAGTILKISDTLCLAFGSLLVGSLQEDGLSLLVFYITALAIILTLHIQRKIRQYDIGRARFGWQSAIKLVGAWGIASAVATGPGLLITQVTPDDLGQMFWLVIGSATVGASARLLAAWQIDKLIHQGYWRSRIVVIGGGELGQRLVQHLRNSKQAVEIVGLFDDRFDRLPRQIASVPVLGGIEELLVFARNNPIDEVVVALPKGAERRLSDWFHRLAILPLKVSHCQDIPAASGDRLVTDLFGLPAAQLAKRPLDGWGFVVKAVEDRVLALFALVASIPVMLAIAAAIKLTSKGPILFQQQRFGFNNNRIEVLKFRTMHVHEGPLKQARRGDPRITSIGRFLRKTSLDELPQLINVLKGDMSLVGPRPHAVAHNEQYAASINDYLCRHRVKPGITGWAQVNGWRGETDNIEKMEARVAHDLYYIENWSLLLDIKIIMLTIIVGFRHPNAY